MKIEVDNGLTPEVVDKDRLVLESEEEAQRALIRAREGLTYEELCRTVVDGMKAETVLINKHTLQEVGRVANHTVRAKFAPLAAEMLGAKKAESAAQRIPSIVILLPDGKKLL